MRIRYENTMEDLFALQEHFIARSPVTKRSMVNLQLVGSGAMFLLLFLVLTVLKGKRTVEVNLVISLLAGVLYFFIIPQITRRHMKKQVVNFYSDGKDKGFLCEHELEIVEDGIIERTQFNETKTAWGAVANILSTPEHTFLFIGTTMAHVIPHTRLIADDYRTFMEELVRRYKPDQTLQPMGQR